MKNVILTLDNIPCVCYRDEYNIVVHRFYIPRTLLPDVYTILTEEDKDEDTPIQVNGKELYTYGEPIISVNHVILECYEN